MDPPEVLVPKNVAAITGPTLIGIVLNWYSYGLLTAQYIVYLMYAQNDRLIIKVIVHLILLLNTFQSALVVGDAFYWFAYHFGDTSKLYDFHFVPIDTSLLDTIIALIIQVVYCWRIWVLSRWRALPIVTGLLALLTGACGIYLGVRGLQRPSFFTLNLESYRIPIQIWFSASTIVDVIIASSMCYILLPITKNSAGVRPTTRRRIMRLVNLSIETNAVTAASSLLGVIIFFIRPLVKPPDSIFIEPGGYVLGQLYSNCFMLLLNQRHHDSSGTSAATMSGTRPTQNIEFTDFDLGFNTGNNTSHGSSMSEHEHQHQISKPWGALKFRYQRDDRVTGTAEGTVSLPQMTVSTPVQGISEMNERC